MDVFALTRELVDIPSISGDEEAVGKRLHAILLSLCDRYGGFVELDEVEPGRFNVFGQWGDFPTVTLSTHMDTVPPFFGSSEDDSFIRGRGSCDAKGIAAAMIVAVAGLLEQGASGLGLLFVIGEEQGSAGALKAGKTSKGSRFLINGEPTENQLALGTKGALRYEITATGRMAHSAYPELGESAIEKLLDALERLRKLSLPTDKILGKSTLNIGTIRGGRAPNVIPDEARAELLIRLVGDAEPVRALVNKAVEGLAEAKEVLFIPARRLGSRPGFNTTVVAYTTDIPPLAQSWGEPYLLGPGTIHVAHTPEERVSKSQLLEAVELYKRLALELLNSQEAKA